MSQLIRDHVTLRQKGLEWASELARALNASMQREPARGPPQSQAKTTTKALFEKAVSTPTVSTMETLHVPATVPVMTLPNTVFFPQALLPLHIFEPRYQQMLRDVLASDRMFAIAHLDASRQQDPKLVEPLHLTASVGIIRACQKGEGDTSNLLLQGICRVTVKKIVREEPYRVIAVKPLATTAGTHQAELEVLRFEVMRLLNLRRRLGTPAPKGMTQFLESIEDVDTFADIAVFNLCEDSAIKQQLLETLETRRRLQIFAASLKSEIEAQRLRRKLQGHLPDDHIADN